MVYKDEKQLCTRGAKKEEEKMQRQAPKNIGSSYFCLLPTDTHIYGKLRVMTIFTHVYAYAPLHLQLLCDQEGHRRLGQRVPLCALLSLICHLIATEQYNLHYT